MAAEIVADSSALLAYVFGEPGAHMVEPWLSRQAICASTVNIAETVSKLVVKGASPSTAWTHIQMLEIKPIDFNLAVAQAACEFAVLGKTHGISFADRACVATALVLKLPMLTADRLWRDAFPSSLDIRLIR